MKKPSFDDFFVPQQDDYSCGAACLATIARLYGIAHVDYGLLRQQLDPNPETGTSHAKMIDVGRSFPCFASAGIDCYSGGIAIANIFDEEGHYVVFLCRKEDQVVYYDPYCHAIVTKNLSGIEWISDEGVPRWALNFKPLADGSFERWQNLGSGAL